MGVGGSSANLSMNGSVTVGDTPSIDLTMMPDARVWGTCTLGASFLAVVAAVKAELSADLNARLKLRVHDYDVDVNGVCFTYQGGNRFWAGLICVPGTEICVLDDEKRITWPPFQAGSCSGAAQAAAVGRANGKPAHRGCGAGQRRLRPQRGPLAGRPQCADRRVLRRRHVGCDPHDSDRAGSGGAGAGLLRAGPGHRRLGRELAAAVHQRIAGVSLQRRPPLLSHRDQCLGRLGLVRTARLDPPHDTGHRRRQGDAGCLPRDSRGLPGGRRSHSGVGA